MCKDSNNKNKSNKPSNDEGLFDLDAGDIEFEVSDIDTSNEQIERLIKRKEDLKKQLKDCKTQLKEHIDLLQKLKIDVINIKKESEEKIKKSKQEAIVDFVKAFLPVFDAVDMAKSFAQDKSDSPLASGVANIYAQFIKILEENDFVVYGKEGDEFDPEFYEAISQKNTDNHSNKNKVAKIFQKGIKAKNGTLIRPAKVEVFID